MLALTAASSLSMNDDLECSLLLLIAAHPYQHANMWIKLAVYFNLKLALAGSEPGADDGLI